MLKPLSLLLVLMLSASAAIAQPQAQANCALERYDNAEYLVCTINPREDNLRVFWQNADGAPLRSFSALADMLSDRGETLAFAFNAGMYGEDFAPIGLYLENGEEIRPLNTRTVEGTPAQIPKFYKKPNGVFYLDEHGAGIVTTQMYSANPPPARFATQSGPMLVIDGQLHPALIEGSRDKTRRSGVGVCDGGMVQLVASQGSVNFYDFARLFRDHLSCPNALFLDGGRGVGVYAPSMRRNDFSWHGGYGPMLGAVVTPPAP